MALCDAGTWKRLKCKNPLSAATLAYVKELGFHYMAPVQATAIPFLLQHQDVVVEAVTGAHIIGGDRIATKVTINYIYTSSVHSFSTL